ncbi:MAG: magnesium chelatase, partial [Eubacteriales bacterium]
DPLLDRIDIQIEVPSLEYGELSSDVKEEPSSKIRERVTNARKVAEARFASETRENGSPITHNSQMEASHIRKYCALSPECQSIMKRAFETLGLSARGHDRILRLARTIADLDGAEDILPKHLAEAIQLRTLDKKYF